MEFTATHKNLKQAFQGIWKMFTPSEQKEQIDLVMEATGDAVTFHAQTEMGGFSCTVLDAEVLSSGSVFLDARDVQEFYQVRSGDDWFIALEDESTLLNVQGEQEFSVEAEEVELEAIPEATPLATLHYVDLASLMTEVMSNPTKSARDFTESLLLRLRRGSLNGRNINMHAIVTNSINVETENDDLVDFYLDKKQAQFLNKFMKTMPKAKKVSLSRNEGGLSIQTERSKMSFTYRSTEIPMPDITALMKRSFLLNKEKKVEVSQEEWKKRLTEIQKSIPAEEREGQRVWIKEDGTLSEIELDAPSVIVKNMLKLVRSIQSKTIDVSYMEQALVMMYKNKTRTHCSVLMTTRG